LSALFAFADYFEALRRRAGTPPRSAKAPRRTTLYAARCFRQLPHKCGTLPQTQQESALFTYARSALLSDAARPRRVQYESAAPAEETIAMSAPR